MKWDVVRVRNTALTAGTTWQSSSERLAYRLHLVGAEPRDDVGNIWSGGHYTGGRTELAWSDAAA